MELAEFQPYARSLSRWFPTSGGGTDEQDVYQEAMVGAWRALQKYDGRGEVVGYVKLQMKRRVIDYVRHRSHGKTITPPSLVPLEGWAAIGPDVTLERVLERESLRAFIDAFNGLRDSQRLRLLSRIEGRSPVAIAEADGCTVTAIDQALYRGAKALKLALAA